jgi:hypothetical protein
LSRTIELLRSKFILVSALHTNSLELATVSEEQGADALEVHLNLEDSASAIRFGNIDLEETAIKEIIGSVKIPVGVCVGEMPTVSKEEWENIVGTGVDYVKMLAHHMPSYVYNDERVSKIVGIGTGYIVEQVKILAEDSKIGAIEASIVAPQVFRHPLNLLDICTYTLITRLSSRPVIVPTQKFIEPSDLRLLRKIGVRGIVTNPVVTGTTVESYRVIEDYKKIAAELDRSFLEQRLFDRT